MNKIFLSGILFLALSCSDVEMSEDFFDHNPTVAYPTLNVNDFWLDKFDERGLQNAFYYKDLLFCNTINSLGEKDFLYCLNLSNGRVVWKAEVEGFATQSVCIYQDTIVFSTFVGDVHAFNLSGNQLWTYDFPHCYVKHCISPENNSVYIKDVLSSNNQISLSTGKLISEVDDFAYKFNKPTEIKKKISKIYLINQANYQYTVKVSNPENGFNVRISRKKKA